MNPLLKFFEYKGLPKQQQFMGILYQKLALEIIEHVPDSPEKTLALRKLIQSRDEALRAIPA
jgi:hypothetical protein